MKSCKNLSNANEKQPKRKSLGENAVDWHFVAFALILSSSGGQLSFDYLWGDFGDSEGDAIEFGSFFGEINWIREIFKEDVIIFRFFEQKLVDFEVVWVKVD